MKVHNDIVIGRLSEVAAQVFPNKEGKVFLFGSHARGDVGVMKDAIRL